MNIFRTICETVLEALFPASVTERELLALTPAEAWRLLPPAPPYAGLTVPLPGARSIFAYKDERVSRLVWSIKYKKSRHAVAIGGYALWRTLVAGSGAQPLSADPNDAARWLPESLFRSAARGSAQLPAVIIVPMPVSPRRRRERGFNQCELLADEIERLEAGRSARVAANGRSRLVIEKGLLKRVRHVSRQTLKDRGERLRSASGIFSVDQGAIGRLKIERLNDCQIVVIDDVITTGSTMKAALDALEAAGFNDVRGLSLAH